MFARRTSILSALLAAGALSALACGARPPASRAAPSARSDRPPAGHAASSARSDLPPGGRAAPSARPDLRTFVTQWFAEGTPYRQAKAYGPKAVPELIGMLRDSLLEEHREKVIYTLGCIGDASAATPLLDFLADLRGEISFATFQAALAVPPALGHVARRGNPSALRVLMELARRDPRRTSTLRFGYQLYRDQLLAEVMGRMALQGLGISGRREAEAFLTTLQRDPGLPREWRDNVQEALDLNRRVRREGPDRVFGQAGS